MRGICFFCPSYCFTGSVGSFRRIKQYSKQIKIPKLSLVILIGPSGSGKSTFAHRIFLPGEVLSSDYCRGLVSDHENDQAATNDSFDVLHYVDAKRLARGRLRAKNTASPFALKKGAREWREGTRKLKFRYNPDGDSDSRPLQQLPLLMAVCFA